MKLSDYCNSLIKFSFYSLFIFVPILLSQHTSELFELNKMWFTWGATIIIVSAWLIKMLTEKRFVFKRTIFDIPILLFLISQIISTIFSLDQRISFFGYYSRFNGGLLSTITYILLYYAFVSNLNLQHVKKILSISLLTGLFVALWGFPSHFGKDPNCLLFRGTFDVSCWTEAFHPTVRIFSTLGQPAWLAAYLALLLPLVTAFVLINKDNDREKTAYKFPFLSIKTSTIAWGLVAGLFYIDLLFANTRAGFLGFWIAYIIFWSLLWMQHTSSSKKLPLLVLLGANMLFMVYTILTSSYPLFWLIGILTYTLLLLIFYRKKVLTKTFLLLNITFILLTSFFSSPFPEINSFFSVSAIKNKIASNEQQQAPTPQEQAPAGTALESGGGTESGNIRRIVWKGALDAWRANPVFGTGVETFAFAYYKHRPAEHNLTSEWDYLYNKAHNEYLNYLTTTGLFGLGTYLLFIGSVLLYAARYLWQNSKNEMAKDDYYVISALFAGFISILITNFFGFSVVIMNLYLFLIPAFILMYAGYFSDDNKKGARNTTSPDASQWVGAIVIGAIALYLLFTLLRFWHADRAYALGFNLHRVGDYQNSYMKLSEAVTLRPAEPIFKDEFALSNATIATALYLQQASASAEIAQQAGQFAQQALNLTNEVTTNHPNNIVFWKNRVKIFYLLSNAETPSKNALLQEAIHSLEKVHTLAPTDVKVLNNLGSMYYENGEYDNAITALEKAVMLKPNYRDAYYVLGSAYYAKATDQSGNIIDPAMQQKAIAAMQAILEKIDDKDGQAIKSIEDWSKGAASPAATSRR